MRHLHPGSAITNPRQRSRHSADSRDLEFEGSALRPDRPPRDADAHCQLPFDLGRDVRNVAIRMAGPAAHGFGRGPRENDGLNWPHCDGVRASEAVALAWRRPLAVVRSSLARWPTTYAARRCRIGLMHLSALLPGLCSRPPLVLGCAVSDWHGPLTVCGTGAVRSRSDGSGPLDATFAAAFWSARC